ncbi:ABC transporter permease [Methanobacterium sp.]|uniref:ABC transporter permease n=1 Tax=Methanobacterium sp. TaxID=2164 RepID=UPI003C74072F
MKFISIAKKDLKELLRDRRGLFFILLFPLFFMLIFGFAYGNMGENNEPHNIAVINYDQGIAVPGGTNINFGNKTIDVLKDAKYPNSDVNTFNVTITSESDADNLAKQKSVDAELIIPANFSKSISSLTPSTVIVRGDTSYMGFGTSQAILSNIIGQYQSKLSASLQNSGASSDQSQALIQAKVEGMPGTESFTNFDYLAPGMIVFAILMLATSVATILTREVESGTLRRLKLSKMTSFDFLFGGLIPWSLVAAAQVLILFAVAIGIGFHWQGSISSIILAVIIGIIGGIASIALGMIIASFAKNPPQAGQLGTLVAVPMTFLVGAFIPLPQIVIGNFMGQQVQIYDILPWHQVLIALRDVLTFGYSLNSIIYQVGTAIALSAILFAIGVFLFSRNRLRPDNS